MHSGRAYFVITAVLVLGSCGSSTSSSIVPASAPSDPVIATAGAATTAATEISTTTTAPLSTTVSVTPPPTSSPLATAPAGIARCATSALAVTLGEGDATMGTDYTALVFTNTGSEACTLDGHPGVSFIDDVGNQVGPSAKRTPPTSPTPTISLAPGERAHATFVWRNAALYGDDCAPVTARRMKIYPPDQTTAIIIHVEMNVCTGLTGEYEQYLYIDPVLSGVTISDQPSDFPATTG